MTDDQQPDPLEPIPTAEPVTDPAATPATDPPTVEAPTGPPTAPTPVTTSAPPPIPPPTPPPARRTVTMPLWAFVAVGGVLLLGLGFLLGWAVAPGDDDRDGVTISGGDASELPFGGNRSPFGGNGDGNGNGNGFGDGGSILGNTAFLGVVVENSSDPDGAAIVRVAPSSPAADAGLEAGDVITEVDGDEVADAAALTRRIRSADPGDTVTIGYERDGDDDTVDVELEERPAFDITPPTTSPSAQS
jgi:membrane-associated protease RseP (regulator of RpoE activity)